MSIGEFFLPSGGMSTNYRNAIVFIIVSVVGLLTYRFLEVYWSK